MKKSPGWVSVTLIVLVGMVLSSFFTLAVSSGVNYAMWGRHVSAEPAPQQSAPDPEAPGVGNEPGDGGDVAEDSWAKTAAIIGPSTVSIQVVMQDGEAEGSGVIYGADGTVLTNAHVIGGATDVYVTLAQGITYRAEIVGSDPSTDIAIVRILNGPDNLRVASFADSSGLKVGEDVMAVGTPLGLANTATTGIISALNRPVVTGADGSGDVSEASFTSAIQTDASVNPGNSGGPLVNRAGEVVGINSSIATNATSQEDAGSIGLSFAIPGNTAKLIADQLIATGKAEHALLGVRAQDGNVDLGTSLVRGAEIIDVVNDSAAAKEGLKEGDVITAVDDVNIGSSAALTSYIRSLEVGSRHLVTYYRDGEENTASVVLTGR